MHIAIMTGGYLSSCGVGTSAREWTTHLTENQYNVSVLATDVNIQDNIDYLSFIKINDVPFVPQVFFYLMQLLLLHHRKRIDVVHTHDSIAFLASPIFGRLTGVPNIFTFHASIFSEGREADYSWVTTQVFKFANRFTARRADKLVCVSREMIDCARFAGASEDKLILFHNPIDLSLFKNTNRRRNGNTCLYVGGLRPVKGVEYIIRAVPDVLERLPQTKFILVGDGSSRKDIEQLITEIGMSESVQLAGRISREKLLAYYQKADVFVMPSLNEPQGIVALEAMACGLPVVGSNVGGIPEMVRDGENGLLVTPGNASALSDAIITLLTNKQLIRNYSVNALQTAENFSWENNIEKMIDLYEGIVQGT